ncbi:hypothetical protein SMC26_35600 [Actinomadura fulvescens]|uniref:Uncharacterized protein n=1 Tax=Actinomadura fulvescens TaxID=46160 RepID=A0ABN3QKY6_9ACTN
MMRRPVLTFMAAIAVATVARPASTSPPPPPPSPDPASTSSDVLPEDAPDYWTPERTQDAEPAPMPTDD